MIRSQALDDYEQVRQGTSPIHANRPPLAALDGGSLMWEESGYRVMRLKRYAGDPYEDELGEHQEYLVGARLEFTCRGRFPLLQRWMKDREDTKIVVEP